MFVYTVGDILLGIYAAVMILFIAGWVIHDWYRQWRCKHEKYYENMACHAICSRCGKDLGFIGTVREERNGRKS